jgi:exopolyphosphatase/guanosine-5'-triphosphate,3'-diphosphate pyrophosphatase
MGMLIVKYRIIGESNMQRDKSEIIAGIDVGSHALRMKIVQVKKNGQIKTLELLRKPISLGRDTYTMGKISFEAVDETCDILKGFKKLMKEYEVKNYKAVATSAIREAKNREYIIDQIKLKTGLNIDVIDNSEERFLTYKAIRENLKDHEKLRKEGVLIVDIGSGSIEISGYEENLLFTQNIKLGSLRLREILSSIERRTLNFPRILEEYIHSNIDGLKNLYFHQEFSNFIALGGEIRIIHQLCNEEENLNYIKKEDFERIYEIILHKPVHRIVEDHDIPYQRADVLVPSMIIFKKFLDMTKGDRIHVPLVSLRDGIVSDLVDQRYRTKRSVDFHKDIVSLARNLAKRYLYDSLHAEDVENKAILLFDALQSLHGLGDEERLLLRLSAILHDVGKFINSREHYKNSYKIIKGSNFIGISQEKLEIIANIARYHSRIAPSYSHKSFSSLSEKNRVIVSKLVAIIRLADGLDKSHQQKIKDMKVILKEKEVLITATTTKNILLEEWTFSLKSEFFQEVFGIKPILKIKRKMIDEF